MRKVRMLWAFMVVAALAVVWIGWTLGQEAQPDAETPKAEAVEPKAPAEQAAMQRRTEWQRRRRVNRDNVRNRMLDRMKERLEASDEEWKELQPKVDKLMALSQQSTNNSGMRRLYGRGRGRTRELAEDASAVEKATAELTKLLEDKDAMPEAVQEKLTALRKAREQARKEHLKAQEEIKKLLDVYREAELVLMGLMD